MKLKGIVLERKEPDKACFENAAGMSKKPTPANRLKVLPG